VGALALSVLSFGADADRDPDALARLARRAEASGFVAIWLPERHFHPFGGACPEPAVAAAALTAHTRTLRLRAGSVLLPLHPPLAVAERWAMVDRLSGGRVELAFAAGWDAASFALAPAAWPGRREALADAVAQVQAAWRGDAVSVVDGRGDPVALRSLPRPIQPELPTWATVAGDPAAWARAGEAGHDVLTALLFQSPAALTEGIARYRAARAAGGHGPGRVCLMLHAAVGVPWAQVRPALRDYLAASVDLWAHEAHVLDALRGPQRDAVLDAAVERVAGLGLFGAPDVCAARAATFAAAGVDELALLVDLGLPEPVVLDSLDAAMRACGVPVASDATPADLPALPPVGQAAPGDPFAAALAWDAPAQARAVDAFPYLVPVEAPVGPRSRVDGAPVWNLSTLDYLGLGADPRVRAAAADAAARWGSTVSGPRVYHGTTAEALTLEARLAAFLGRPAAMTLGSGYLAVLSAVAGLLGPGGALVVDELAHASFFDGAAIAGCAVRRFAHDDPDDLARVLDRLAGRPILVAVEGVYSNEGDVASYGALRAVCGARGVRLLVDDAHGLGVLGRTGRGLEEHAGLPGTADLIVGSLSKALGSTGGFIAGPAAVIEWLRLRARPSLFSASTLPPPAVAAATAGLDILAREPERVAVLGARAAAWRAALARRGVPTLPGVGPLVPIPVGDEARCRALAVDLRRRGVLVSAVIPPSVPPGGARLRTVATWGFDGADEAAERLAQALFA
jgi:natural product biosynthesis luciferase-like monooxygenase protein